MFKLEEVFIKKNAVAVYSLMVVNIQRNASKDNEDIGQDPRLIKPIDIRK